MEDPRVQIVYTESGVRGSPHGCWDSMLTLSARLIFLCYQDSKFKRIGFIRESFEKFVDSPYYSESELRGCAVTVSFTKYFHWQAMHFLQRSTHFSKMCCRNRMGARSELNSVLGLEKVDWWNPIRTSAIQSRPRPMRFLGFPNHE
jgi:hypothetical protein